MKPMSWIKTIILAAVVALPGSQLLAHSALTASSPGHEAVVSSPEELTLNFNEDVRMLRLSLVHGASHNIDFGFAPSTEAMASFSYDLPDLMMGAHTVDWTIVGADGHTVSGSFNFVVSEGGDDAEVQEHSNGDHHHHH